MDPAILAARIRSALPGHPKVQTAEKNAAENAKEINDSIGSFLTPALLALAGAAVLVGAFIIFNTFSITVTQRMREFAMLRALGATRRQVLAVVVGEALMVGLLASSLGILAGIGFSKVLNSLFDAIGFGIPRTGLVAGAADDRGRLRGGHRRDRPRLAHSRAPRNPRGARGRHDGYAPRGSAAAGGGSPRSPPLFAPSPEARLLPTGSSARAPRPRSSVRPPVARCSSSSASRSRPATWSGHWPRWSGGRSSAPLRRPGRLARENAERNPGRTAITSAALMVGLGLVVFVAVFAAGLKASIGKQIDDLIRAQLVVYSQDYQAFPARTERVVRRVPGVKAVVGTPFEQLEVNGQSSNATTDVLIGVDPRRLLDVYTFHWLDGSDALLDHLKRGQTLIEEQFAKAHHLGVGDTYRVVTPSGGRGRLTAVGIYRDPTVLQGSMASVATLRSISPARDPLSLLVALDPGADSNQVQAAIKKALRPFPTVKVQNKAQYQQSLNDRLNQIVYLLYALLAMSLVISLFGIANSLFLSIHERTREIALLRAVGATVAQIRRVIRYESVITAVIGGLLGTAIGILLAWLVIQSLSEFGFSISIPVGQLLVFMGLALLVGVVGAIAPARRASRVDVLEAIHQE